MTLYNVNLKTGECIDERPVDWEYCSLDEFIVGVCEAAEGLTDPSISVEADSHYEDFAHHIVAVSGKRQMTTAEISRITSEREQLQRFRQHMAAFRG